MPAQKKNLLKQFSLNLLYPQSTPQAIYLKFIKWLLNYGRFIVIIVEIVVVGAFVTRFKLDSDNADLEQKIKNQIPYIQSLKKAETFIRRTQFKLGTIQKVLGDDPDWHILLGHIDQQMPEGVKLQALSFDKQPVSWNFRLSGNAVSNSDLALFLGGLRQDNLVKDLNLVSLSFDKGLIFFSITGGISHEASSSAQNTGGSL